VSREVGSLHFPKRGHFNSEVGSLRAGYVMYCTMLLGSGESVPKCVRLIMLKQSFS
jgi:hypothetical protein